MSKLLTVIHIDDLQQTKNNVRLSKELGADGCFMIDHKLNKKIYEIYDEVKNLFPEFWIGINDLSSTAFDSLPSVDGFWVDNIDWIKTNPLPEKRPLIFGGVAFKYQPKVPNIAVATRSAIDFCDVITTSGAGTGEAPSVNKIKIMKENAKEKPLAVASGINEENVSSFLPYVDYFLVSTGISKSFYDFDPVKLENLVGLIKQ